MSQQSAAIALGLTKELIQSGQIAFHSKDPIKNAEYVAQFAFALSNALAQGDDFANMSGSIIHRLFGAPE